ncbi:MAG: gamma-glutamyl-gamma-aminobutyrate hydrolase family protein, partial [Victivallales bacterium]|nr:gamma-glutamyl-gamma-aminobutyrate hydrolase family protein [Victivallales bacterium]
MEGKPIIGIPKITKIEDIYNNYLNAVKAGGGEPLVLAPVSDEIESQVAKCDGFIFMGGPDFRQNLSRCKIVQED